MRHGRVLAAVPLLAIALLSCAARKPAALAAPAPPPAAAPRVEKVADGVWCAVGYALSNVGLVAVDGGKVVVDATESVTAAREVRAEFDRLAPGPVLALIYTHGHPDHVLGASAFRDDGTAIWAGARTGREMSEQFASLGPTLRLRGARQYGEGLADRIPIGIGPRLRLDDGPAPPLLYPTRTFEGQARFAIGGVAFDLREAPGETIDQIRIWLPEKKVLFPGDDVYRAFPNLYATRGVPPRPVRGWIKSLDEMRGLGAEALSPGHTEPVVGAAKIAEILTAYRDGIAFVHDSVIRMANEGRTPDDMVRAIKLPPRLASHPYLQETYGEVGWSVRGIYDGYLGWFDGNAAHLHPLHPADRASRLLPLLGGRGKALAEARAALAKGDAQWAAELADLPLALDPADGEAKAVKARALRALGERQVNSNDRHYLLTSAGELDGTWTPPPRPRITAATIREVPIETILDALPERLQPEKTADVAMTVGFDFTDTGKRFAFFIRRGVGEVAPRAPEKPDLVLAISEADFKALLAGELPGAKALAAGRLRATGGLANLAAFQSYLIGP